MVGYRAGRQLVERYAANRPRLGENLDVIKFICKEFWNEVFHKQVGYPSLLLRLVLMTCYVAEGNSVAPSHVARNGLTMLVVV